jgi:hypothetical protein
MRRTLALAGAFVALGVAVVLILLAVDVRRYERALADDDATFRANPARQDLWEPPQLVPFGAARGMLGVGDQIAYRRAVRLFALGEPRVHLLETTPAMQRYRSEAAVTLWRLGQSDRVAWRRSRELNLLGVLDLLALGANEPIERMRGLLRATASFRRAIAADERGAEQAKVNLELSLRMIAAVRATNPTLKGLGGSATHRPESGGSGY